MVPVCRPNMDSGHNYCPYGETLVKIIHMVSLFTSSFLFLMLKLTTGKGEWNNLKECLDERWHSIVCYDNLEPNDYDCFSDTEGCDHQSVSLKNLILFCDDFLYPTKT